MAEKTNKDLIIIKGKKYRKRAFMIEETHPAIGRIIIIDEEKFKILDENDFEGGCRSGTFIAKLTEEDEQIMDEYDKALESLSEKLVTKVDIKRLIKENMKTKSLQEIKTGLFILKAEEDGKKIEEEHNRHCYNYKMFYKNQCFEFSSGGDF